MPDYKPEEIYPLLEDAVSNGDMDAYLVLYEADATLVKQDGTPAAGLDAIREEIAPILAVKGTLTVKVAKVIQSGEVALVHSRGAFSATTPDGTPIEIPEHDAAEVLRQQADGTWRMIINNPWGPPG